MSIQHFCVNVDYKGITIHLVGFYCLLIMCSVALLFEITNTSYINITLVLTQIHKQIISFLKIKEIQPGFVRTLKSYTAVWARVCVRV